MNIMKILCKLTRNRLLVIFYAALILCIYLFFDHGPIKKQQNCSNGNKYLRFECLSFCGGWGLFKWFKFKYSDNFYLYFLSGSFKEYSDSIYMVFANKS